MSESRVMRTLLSRISSACKNVSMREQIRHTPYIDTSVASNQAMLNEIYKGIRFLENPHLAYLVHASGKIFKDPPYYSTKVETTKSSNYGYRYAPSHKSECS